MKHLILGTAGHVDHGKTSLIKALTNIDCDTHQEEKQRGITINLGFSHLQLPSGNSLGIIDVPGHKDFIHTMISGASSIDIALLVIAADSGIMPQTLEHLHIIKTLGIKSIVVALNKSDLVDEDIIELASEEIRELFLSIDIDAPTIVPVSSVTQQNLDLLISTLDSASQQAREKQVGKVFRMYIDRLFSVKGLGSVVTGSVLSGQVTTNDLLYALPDFKETFKVKSIQRHGVNIEQAGAGDRAALNISGLKKEDFRRGLLLSNQLLETTQMIDAQITIFEPSVKLKLWSTVMFYSGTFESLAKIHLLNADSLEKDQKALVQIHLEKPGVLLSKDKFIIRNSSSDKTIGGGFVFDVKPLHHRKRTTVLISNLESLLHATEKESSMAQLVDHVLSKDRRAMSDEQISTALNLPLNEWFSSVSENSLFEVYSRNEQTIIIKKEDEHTFVRQILHWINEHHQQFPILSEGVSGNFFHGKFQINKDLLQKRYFDLLLYKLMIEKKIRKVGTTWALYDFKPSLNEKQEQDIDWFSKLYLSFELQKPIIKDIEEQARQRKISKDALRMYLKYLQDQKTLYRYQDDYIHAQVFLSVAEQLKEELSNKPEGINLSEFRQLIGCTKKIIPVLVSMLIDEKIITTRPEGTHTIVSLL
ncbi:MAG: selenocysteine-specific translation elongation factor [Bacteroidales bacterium]|nr:selenocysteine-specific translation elongation factor [Bacteroidales bacterium]